MAEETAVVPLPTTREWAQRVVRRLGAVNQTESIVWENGLRGWMDEQDVCDQHVLHVLRTGRIREDPERVESGGLAVRLTQRIVGQGLLAVTAVIVQGKQLWITALEWEDQRR